MSNPTTRQREREGPWIAAFDDTEFEVPLLTAMDDSTRRGGEGREREASARANEGQTPPPPPPKASSVSRTSVSAQYSPSTAASATTSTYRQTSVHTQSLSFAMGLMDSTGSRGDERERDMSGADYAQEGGSAPSSPPVTPRETAPFLVLTSAQMGEARNRGSALYDGPPPRTQEQQRGPAPPPKSKNPRSSVQQARPSNASSIETGSLLQSSMSVVSSASTSMSASASSTVPLVSSSHPSSSSSSTPLSQSHQPHGQTTGPSGSGASGPAPPTPGFVSPFARQSPRGSTNFIPPSNSGATNGSASATASGSGRGSMILYRLSAGEDDVLSASSSTNGLSALHALSMANAPPGLTSPTALGAWNNNNRNSAYSSDGDRDSAYFDGDSKYPVLLPGGGVGLQTPNRTPRGSVFRLGPGQRTPPLPGTPSPMGTMNAGKATAFTIGMRSSMAEVGDVGKVHGGLVAYVFDPEEEDDDEGEEERWMHDPSGVNPLYKELGVGGGKGGTVGSGVPTFGTNGTRVNASAKAGVHYASTKGPHAEYRPRSSGISWRGVVNITTLVTLILGLLCLFMVYPITQIYTNDGVDARILGNTRINATGQAEGFVVNGNNGGNGVNNNLGVVGGHLEANLRGKDARTRREWRFERDEEGS